MQCEHYKKVVEQIIEYLNSNLKINKEEIGKILVYSDIIIEKIIDKTANYSEIYEYAWEIYKLCTEFNVYIPNVKIANSKAGTTVSLGDLDFYSRNWGA
jgi:hypothetical protein